MYDPTDSSLTRQAWAYQQKLIYESGEGLGQLPARTPAVTRFELGVDKNYVMTCGVGFLSAGFAGYVAGKIGVLPTAVGVGLAYGLIKSMER